jgi:hypothetical protein
MSDNLAWCHVPVTPPLRRLRKKNQEFEANLGQHSETKRMSESSRQEIAQKGKVQTSTRTC